MANASGPDLDLDDVIEAWPAALEALRAPVRAMVQEAQPIGIERGAIVFGAPRKRFEAIHARFRSEASEIKAALEARLGAQPSIIVRAHDFDTVDALRPVTKPAAAGTNDAAEPHEEFIDVDELVDAPDAPAPDPAARLVAGLGAEIVEERSATDRKRALRPAAQRPSARPRSTRPRRAWRLYHLRSTVRRAISLTHAPNSTSRASSQNVSTVRTDRATG